MISTCIFSCQIHIAHVWLRLCMLCFWLLAEVIHHLTGNDWCVIMLKSSAMLSCFLIILSFVNIFSKKPAILRESLMIITLTRSLRKQRLTMLEDKWLPAVLSIVSIINHIVGRVECSSYCLRCLSKTHITKTLLSASNVGNLVLTQCTW